jgi:hypothetical protein
MTDSINLRISAAGNDVVGGAIVPTIVLARDIGELTGPIRAPEGKVFQQAMKQITLAGSATTTLSLRSASNTWVDPIGQALNLESLAFWLIEVLAPAADKSLRYGPQGGSGAAPLWFSGVGSTVYSTVTDAEMRLFRTTPLTIGDGAANVVFTNPGSVSVTARLWVGGMNAS